MFKRLSMVMLMGAMLAVGAFAFGEYRRPPNADVVTIPISDEASSLATLASSVPGSKPQASPDRPVPKTGSILYGCENGRAFGVEYGKNNGAAELTMNDGTSRLDPVFVAEGAEWSDGTLTLMIKGDFAEVFFAGQSASGTCVAQQ
jgi:membrane-bound inhibitor of C-type lysozyme